MRDIRNINSEKEVVFEVAMIMALERPNTYYIFRSTTEQIEITVSGEYFISSQLLLSEEIKHIKKYYPFLDYINYKVRAKKT